MGELLRTLVGSGWCAEWTRRCGAHFRKLPAPMWKDGVYQEVMGLLVERGLGEVREQLWEDEVQDVFVKGCFSDLTKEAKDALKEMGVPGWSFGPPCKADAAQSQTCPRWGGKVRRQQCRLWMVKCSGCLLVGIKPMVELCSAVVDHPWPGRRMARSAQDQRTGM